MVNDGLVKKLKLVNKALSGGETSSVFYMGERVRLRKDWTLVVTNGDDLKPDMLKDLQDSIDAMD